MIYINGVAIVGDMFKAVYDPDLDGLIALAQLVAAVCSETEADNKIAAAFLSLTTDFDTSWGCVAMAPETEHEKLAEITGKGVARVELDADGGPAAVTRIYIDGTIVWELPCNAAETLIVIFFTTLKITAYNTSPGSTESCCTGTVRGNYGA